ncbi:MAG TPA: hypothetical protein VHO70_07235, partial [Chitinispirillaceae bacterium]|nr:hypothetical protein [Chitinispirillaceae bacterium]
MTDQHNRRILISCISGILLISGTLFTVWLIKITDYEMRQDLLTKAEMISQSLDLQMLCTLTGTKEDNEKPEYQRLKKQFASLVETDRNCRFIYLMGRKEDGRVFFYLDSEPPGSKEESSAGQMYGEITLKDIQVFDTKRASTVGPESDRWGTWITSLVPVSDPQ